MTVSLDFGSLFVEMFADDQRIPDGKLHPSTHLLGHLRHSQLDLAGAPTKKREFANSARLESGTMWHERIHNRMRKKGVPHMAETKLDAWLPDGWAGTADCLLWNAEHRAFALIDYKTIEGKGVYWIETQGAKEGHIWQLSAYLYACEAMGIPVFTDEGYILYIPITEGQNSGVGTCHVMMEVVKPINKDLLHNHMADIKSKTDDYLDSVEVSGWTLRGNRAEFMEPVAAYLTDALADPPAREQKLFWDKDKKIFHVRLVPPWGAKYCPYHEPLCTCSSLKTEKIGEYSMDKEYSPREGYEEIVPTVVPTDSEVNKRKGTK